MDKCKAKVQTTNDKKSDGISSVIDDFYTHTFDKAELEPRKVKAKVKKDASKTSESSINIIGKATSMIYEMTSEILPLNKSLCRTVQRDGTFDPAPSIFKQLYTLHGRLYDNLIPLVYVLTTDKMEESYTYMLQRLCTLRRDLDPSLFIVDF